MINDKEDEYKYVNKLNTDTSYDTSKKQVTGGVLPKGDFVYTPDYGYTSSKGDQISSNTEQKNNYNNYIQQPLQNRKEIIYSIYNAIQDRLMNPNNYNVGDNFRFFRNLNNASNMLQHRDRNAIEEKKLGLEERKFGLESNLAEFNKNLALNKQELDWFREKKPSFVSGNAQGLMMYDPNTKEVVPVQRPEIENPIYQQMKKDELASKIVSSEKSEVNNNIQKLYIDYVNNRNKDATGNTPPMSMKAFYYSISPEWDTDPEIHKIQENGRTIYGRLFYKRNEKGEIEKIFVPFTPEEHDLYINSKENKKK